MFLLRHVFLKTRVIKKEILGRNNREKNLTKALWAIKNTTMAFADSGLQQTAQVLLSSSYDLG